MSSQISRWFGKVPAKIAMVGLDAAGKTTVLYKLHLGEIVTTIPTIGFNVEKLEYKNLTMTIWDVGGQKRLRQLWHHYYEGLNAFIFVVDSTDRERFDEAANELELALQNDQLRGVPVLVYANKQDMPSAANVSDIRQSLRLDKLGSRAWYIQGCSALHGDGVFEGLDWLAERVRKGPPAQ